MEDLRWDVVNEPENDSPNFRLLSSNKEENSDEIEMSLIRTNDRDELSLSVKAFKVNVGNLKSFKLVGSASGAICLFIPSEKVFKLWNPVEHEFLEIKKPPLTPVAYAFYDQILRTKHPHFILAVARNTDGSASVSRYSTLLLEWTPLPDIKAVVRASAIVGAGCKVGSLIYWPNYSQTRKFNSVTIFDTSDSKFHVDPIESATYDFMCTFVKRVNVNSSSFMITKCDGVTNVLSSDDSGWSVLCSAPNDSSLIDILSPSLFLIVRAGAVVIVNTAMESLSQYAFEPHYSPDCLFFRPNFDTSYLKGKKPIIKQIISGIRRSDKSDKEDDTSPEGGEEASEGGEQAGNVIKKSYSWLSRSARRG